jgi:hypothetical protein
MNPLFLKPFWSFFGSKWASAPRYPEATHRTIIEPFAGSAGYSMRYYQRNIILVELDEIVAEVWHYLTRVSAAEIRAIPIVRAVDDLPSWVPLGGRWLVGFNFGYGIAVPLRTFDNAFSRADDATGTANCWSERKRERIAQQVELIRHWKIIEGSYDEAPDIKATWFIDPPYQSVAGKHYRCSNKQIDFTHLSRFAQSRRGQVIACDNYGATWLPFQLFSVRSAFNKPGVNLEAIWTRG